MDALKTLFAQLWEDYDLATRLPPFVLGLTIITIVLIPLLLGGNRKPPATLDPEKKIDLQLIAKEKLSPDTFLFRFALPTPEHRLGLPTGQHISISFVDDDGKPVARSYTPTSADDQLGTVEFVIKVYFANVHPKFPAGGKMTQHMHAMKIGDSLSFQGPKGKVEYQGRGKLAVKRTNPAVGEDIRRVKHLGMIAGGTGITPMLSIVRAILKDGGDTTAVSLLFANQTEADILLRKELDMCAREFTNFKVWYTLDRPPPGWAFSTGFVTDAMIKDHLPAPGPHTQVLVCGPPPMVDMACKPALEALGFTPDSYVLF